LASIGRLTVSVGKSFALMFRLGAGEAGVRLIDGLRQKFEQFSAFMKANPDVIRRFFGDAAAVTEAVGRALLGIIRIFDALDTHTSRQGVVAFFSLMGDTLNVLGGIIAFVTQQFDVLGSKFSIFGAAFDFVTTAIPGLNGLKTATEGLGKTYGDTANTVNKTKIAPLLNTAPLLQATETIRLTDKEMKALNKQFGIPLPKPQVDVSPLDSAIGKIRELTQSSLDLASTLDPSNGLGGLTVFLSNLQSGLGGLTKGGGVQVPVKPTTDPAALSTVQGQITTAVSAAPAPIKPTLAPGSTQAIKASLDTLKTNNVIPITAGGNAQAVIARTKTALTGLMRTKASLVITAGGNAQAVIARTRAALTSLMSARKNLVITAGGNAQAVIARTQAALNKLIKPVKIDISAGGNAQSVISRTKSALADLPSSKTITIKVTKTGSGASLVARGAILMAEGGVIQSMASGGFANFRQFIRPDVIAGEAGREAVVPLDRPLGQVDPAVRELAAFAQGKFDALLSNAVAKQGINASGWTIVTPTTDPAAVADEVFNRLAAMSY
jgi:hypothetical protein